MNNTTHKQLAKIVGAKAGVPDVDSFAAGAALPDYVDDLLGRLLGQQDWTPEELGYHLAPFQHFGHPIGRRKYNGYCMARDPSWPKELRPPLGQLRVDTTVWATNLGIKNVDTFEHPMVSILRTSTGKTMTQVTYCTAAVYAEWLAKTITVPGVSTAAFWKGVGAIAHLAMDLCVWHHVFLCLLAGHQAYEDVIQTWAINNQLKINAWPVPMLSPPYEIRPRLELVAEATGARKSKPPAEWAVRRGHDATYAVVVWALRQLGGPGRTDQY